MNLFGHKSQPKVTLSYEIMMNCKCVTCSVQSESACAKPKIAARIEMLQNPDPSKMLGSGMMKNLDMLKGMNLGDIRGMSTDQMKNMSDEMMKNTPSDSMTKLEDMPGPYCANGVSVCR